MSEGITDRVEEDGSGKREGEHVRVKRGTAGSGWMRECGDSVLIGRVYF